MKRADLVVLAVLTPPSPFPSWAFSFQELVFPSLPRRGLKCLPHAQCAHFRMNMAQGASSALFPPAASSGSGPAHLGTASLVCPPRGSWGVSPGSPPTGNGHTSLNAHGWVAAAAAAADGGSAKRARTSLGSDTNTESCAHKSLLQL